MNVRPLELICLHTDAQGRFWALKPFGRPAQISLPLVNSSLAAKTYRIIGCKANYRLLTELYSSLVGSELKATVFVGAPRLCSHCDDLTKTFDRLAVLDVQNGLRNVWYAMDSSSYNNFLLLRNYAEEGFSDLTEHVFHYHLLTPYLKFLGLEPTAFVVDFVSLLVDPRWYINSNRPSRLDRVKSYFGLIPAFFFKVWNSPETLKGGPRLRRLIALIALAGSLKSDSVLMRELEGVNDDGKRIFKLCELLVEFLIRHWLLETGVPPTFEPAKFFKVESNRRQYYSVFN